MQPTSDEAPNRGVFLIDGEEVEISIDLGAYFAELDRLEAEEIAKRPKRIAKALKNGRDPRKIPSPKMLAISRLAGRTQMLILIENWNRNPQMIGHRWEGNILGFLRDIAKSRALYQS